MIHPNEPTLAELKATEKELYAAESTDENAKKLHAIGMQIKRHTEDLEVDTPE